MGCRSRSGGQFAQALVEGRMGVDRVGVVARATSGRAPTGSHGSESALDRGSFRGLARRRARQPRSGVECASPRLSRAGSWILPGCPAHPDPGRSDREPSAVDRNGCDRGQLFGVRVDARSGDGSRPGSGHDGKGSRASPLRPDSSFGAGRNPGRDDDLRAGRLRTRPWNHGGQYESLLCARSLARPLRRRGSGPLRSNAGLRERRRVREREDATGGDSSLFPSG